MARGFSALSASISDRAAALLASAEAEAAALGAEIDAGEVTVQKAAAFRAELAQHRRDIEAALRPLTNLPLFGSQDASAAAAVSGAAAGEISAFSPDKATAPAHETAGAAQQPAPGVVTAAAPRLTGTVPAAAPAAPLTGIIARRISPETPESAR